MLVGVMLTSGAAIVMLILCYRRLGSYTQANSAALKAGLLAHRSNLELVNEVRMLREECGLQREFDQARHAANFVNESDDQRIA